MRLYALVEAHSEPEGADETGEAVERDRVVSAHRPCGWGPALSADGRDKVT